MADSNTKNTGQPVVQVDARRDMEIFDSLPREARDALNYSDRQYSAAQIQQILNRGIPLSRIKPGLDWMDRHLREKELADMEAYLGTARVAR